MNELPIEVECDNNLKSYECRNNEGLIISRWERESSPADKPAIVQANEVIQKPLYFGAWKQCTLEQLDRLNKKEEAKRPKAHESSSDKLLKAAEERLKFLLSQVNAKK